MGDSSHCEFPAFNANQAEITSLLNSSKTIAVIGCSPNPDRPSHYVSLYMRDQGYTVIPVNPGHTELLGVPCYKRLLDVPGPIDIVNIFRRPEVIPEIIDEAISKKARAVWMQLGIIHNESAQKAKNAGLQVIMNKCLMVEHRQL